MDKVKHGVKKPYRPPSLRRYGDLRTLTGGGGRKNSENNVPQVPKTRPVGGP